MKYLFVLAALLLSACMPRLFPPQVAIHDHYIYAENFSQDTLSIDSCWWHLFGDSTLDSLIDRALANNRNLAIAASRVQEVRAERVVSRAQYLPQIGVGLSAQGNRTKTTGLEQSYSLEPSLSWEVSLFGALRHTERGARAQIESAEWAWRSMRLSVAAEVATTYFTLLEYERDLFLARRSTTLRRESAALIDSMFRYGMSDGVALAQARSLVHSAESDIPRYERAIEQTRLSLFVLLGETPRPAVLQGSGKPLLSDHRPVDIPVGLPAQLLMRRPDIRESRANLLVAATKVGIAHSARFPAITLTAQGGVASTSLKGLTAVDPWAWSSMGKLVEPVFAFGKLKRAEQASVERYKQAALAYEQTVLTALSDVEAALVSIDFYRLQTIQYSQLVAENDRIATMTQALYRNGFSDYLSVIDAQRELYDSQMQLVNLIAQQYINYINLCKALGGGW
ncbi:MAG: efflux transporter outer membrane subunit [Rikenellaceae bacterium]|nr:efflux transporter outer membrane subunit [Rikenellaceae bacterium]